jgi:hypothetical protein
MEELLTSMMASNIKMANTKIRILGCAMCYLLYYHYFILYFAPIVSDNFPPVDLPN